MAFIPPTQVGIGGRLAGMFSGAGDVFGNLQNAPSATPDEVERQRARAEMLTALATGGDAGGSFLGALAQGLQGFAGGRLRRRADIQEQAGLASADEFLAGNPVLAALTGQDMNAPQGVTVAPQAMLAPLDAGGVPDVSIPQQTETGVDPGIAGAFAGSAPQVSADPGIANYFSAIKSAESGGDPNAKNPLSSATGLYQFTTGTWNQLRQQYPELGLTADGRTDPAQQERAIRVFTADNARILQNAGIPVNGGSLYAAHFLGAGGATKALSQPDSTPMRAAVGAGVVEANPFLADMTVGDFKQWAASKGGGSGAPLAGGPGLPSAAPSNVVASILAAQQNPWVAQRYGPVLDALMQQDMQRQNAAFEAQLAQSDPMYQAQLQAQQLQNQALMNPPAPEPLPLMNAGGGQIYDPNTGQWITAPGAGEAEAPAAFQALEMRAQAAGLEPGSEEYRNFMIQGGRDSGMAIDVDPATGAVSFRQGAGAGSSARPFTEGQSKDNVFSTRAEGALAILDPIAGALTDRVSQAAESVPMGLARGVQSDEFQKAKQAGDEFLQAILRKDTGAAITPDEETLYGGVYLPQPGDRDAVLEQKKQSRRRAVEALKAGMSPEQILAQERALLASGSPTLEPVAQQPEAPTSAPQVGQVEEGYRFLGGNPADPNSWERVQ